MRRRTVIGFAALTALLMGGVWWRASWIVNRLFRSWIVATIAEKSGDVYRLDVGRVRFNVLLRRVAVDSLQVTTNRGINALRPQPRAGLRFAFHDCRITGVHLVTLIRGGGLVADSFGCRAVSVAVVAARRVPDAASVPLPQPLVARRPFLVVQQSL